jgi:release factor glutamine methyltransferase
MVCHEPKLAMDGGKDGLEHLIHLCEGLSSALKPNGIFVFEVKTSSMLYIYIHMTGLISSICFSFVET